MCKNTISTLFHTNVHTFSFLVLSQSVWLWAILRRGWWPADVPKDSPLWLGVRCAMVGRCLWECQGRASYHWFVPIVFVVEVRRTSNWLIGPDLYLSDLCKLYDGLCVCPSSRVWVSVCSCHVHVTYINMLTYILILGASTYELHIRPCKLRPRCVPQDFVRKLLVLEPNKRLTAKKALQHPWVLVRCYSLLNY